MNDFFGGCTVRAKKPMHGKLSAIAHDGQGLFQGIPQSFSVMRYHSLVIERKMLPACLAITAETAEGEVMGLRHKHYPLEAVQFHPESHATEYGSQLFFNWLQLINPEHNPKYLKNFI
jgi:para-aminobenzoate synthetase component 2